MTLPPLPTPARGTFEPKFGKTDARKGAISMRLSRYLAPKLKAAPRNFGHYDLYPEDGWGMFGNDTWGDCVLAGGDHETMVLNLAAGRTVTFDEATALSDYSRITGFTPADPNTDQGTDMQAAASFRRKVGLIDQHGARHAIQAYAGVALAPAKLAQAAHLFGTVGWGFRVPESAMEQFNKGETWHDVGDTNILGGHYVPLVGRKNNRYAFVSWGHLQWASASFVHAYGDEAITYFTPEMLRAGKSPEGLDTAALLADLAAVTAT
jgi:hypothetical protein